MNNIDAARQTIQAAVAEFGGSLSLLTSLQREGVVILDLLMAVAPGTPVVTIDTGRLPRETFEIIQALEARYQIGIERIEPEPAELRTMVSTHGPDLFRESTAHRMLCCTVRKVRPLARRMVSSAAYLTGLRRTQNAERSAIEVFDRSSQPVRISPLADWTAADVLDYTRENALPEHPLYARGYTSIGCDPCTRAVSPGEDERAGRWWWELDAAKECGLHFTPDGRAERAVDVMIRELTGAV